MQPETRVVLAIREHLGGRSGMGRGGLGCVVVKMHGSAYSRDGFPDLLVIRPDGATVYLEVKVPGRTDGPLGNGVEAAQLAWGRRLARQGAEWGWAASPEEAEAVVFRHEAWLASVAALLRGGSADL
jgi:hypothetical protein